MTIPLAVTSYTVQRAEGIEDDSGDVLTWATVATGIPGSPSYYSGSESVAHGDRERVDCRVFMENTYDVRHYDRLVDEGTGDVWSVAFTRHRQGLGLDHLMVGCYAVEGVARGTKDL